MNMFVKKKEFFISFFHILQYDSDYVIYLILLIIKLESDLGKPLLILLVY